MDCLVEEIELVFYLLLHSCAWNVRVAEMKGVSWQGEVLSRGNYMKNERKAYFTKQNKNARNYVSDDRINNIFNFLKLWQAVMGKKIKLQLLFQESKTHNRNEVSVCYISNLFVHLCHCSPNRLATRYSWLQFIVSDSLVFSSSWSNGLLQAVSVRHQLTHIDAAYLAPGETTFKHPVSCIMKGE